MAILNTNPNLELIIWKRKMRSFSPTMR